LGQLLYAQPAHAGYLQLSTGLLGCDALGHIVFAGSYYFQDYDFLGTIFHHYGLGNDIFATQVDADFSAGVLVPFRPAPSRTGSRPYDGLGRERRRINSMPLFPH
jgi:hypothetical protein